MGLLLERGNRGLLVGQTGSGKTQNALFQLKHACSEPVIIFDTKIEDAFFVLDREEGGMELIQSFQDFQRISKTPRKKLPAFILVRPAIDELQNYPVLSDYSLLCLNKFGECFVYFDELYSWHNAGRATNGMIGLYTRGRSAKKTVLGATQRPNLISRFCITECQKFYIHDLIDNRDKKVLGEVIPDFAKTGQLPLHHFHHYETGKQEIVVYSPVPFTDAKGIQVFDKKWL
ncbi:MAG TPA: hypothetical protein VMW50_08460 [Dehalococcoidia bacterium]|nr:hypothetical protein [Dehalococcoidia bacterium]